MEAGERREMEKQRGGLYLLRLGGCDVFLDCVICLDTRWSHDYRCLGSEDGWHV